MASPAEETETRPARRSQAERRAATRKALLEATLECLVERGYARTTTAEIERRAGVSRGARLHHFPSKAALLGAAVEHLFGRIAERYAEAMARIEPSGDRFHAGYRLLWDQYADPVHYAVIELYLAARHDPDLREALRQVSARNHKDVRRAANSYFPDLALREADGLLESLQALMGGLALRRSVFGARPEDERILDLVEHMVHQTFDPASPRPGTAETHE